jgi:hypothetical protein
LIRFQKRVQDAPKVQFFYTRSHHYGADLGVATPQRLEAPSWRTAQRSGDSEPVPAARSADGKIEWKVSLPHAGFQVVELKLSNMAAK